MKLSITIAITIHWVVIPCCVGNIVRMYCATHSSIYLVMDHHSRGIKECVYIQVPPIVSYLILIHWHNSAASIYSVAILTLSLVGDIYQSIQWIIPQWSPLPQCLQWSVVGTSHWSTLQRAVLIFHRHDIDHSSIPQCTSLSHHTGIHQIHISYRINPDIPNTFHCCRRVV